nr:transposase [Amycolatopsis granulosa]
MTPGQAGDSLIFEPLMAHLRVPRRGGGRARTRPDRLRADKAYSSRAIRSHLRRRKIRAVIPEPSDQARHRTRRGARGGRPPAFDTHDYRGHNAIKRSSTRSNNGEESPPATTNSPPSTAPPYSSTTSSPGPQHCQTRPRWGANLVVRGRRRVLLTGAVVEGMKVALVDGGGGPVLAVLTGHDELLVCWNGIGWSSPGRGGGPPMRIRWFGLDDYGRFVTASMSSDCPKIHCRCGRARCVRVANGSRA